MLYLCTPRLLERLRIAHGACSLGQRVAIVDYYIQIGQGAEGSAVQQCLTPLPTTQ